MQNSDFLTIDPFGKEIIIKFPILNIYPKNDKILEICKKVEYNIKDKENKEAIKESSTIAIFLTEWSDIERYLKMKSKKEQRISSITQTIKYLYKKGCNFREDIRISR